MFASLLFVTVVYAAAAAAATAGSPECAAVPLAADYWRGADVANAVDGALVLAFDADETSLESAFATEFAEPQDLRSHAVLSFTLGKSVAPSAVFVVVHTSAGAFRTPAATLFEGANTITVDLASSEFASLDSTDGEFDEPLLGLAAVSSIELRLVAPALGHASASINNMLVCAAAASADAEFADPADVVATAADAAAAAAEPLEFPDVAALSAALGTALGEVQRLGASLDALRTQQRAARRALDEFSVAARDSLDSAVDALATAMSANVDATLNNANVLARVRARLDDAALAHEQRLAQLDAQFDSLRSLAVRDGESLAAAVARTNAAEAEVELIVLEKRNAAAAAAAAAEAPLAEPLVAAAAAVPVVDDAFGAAISVRARAERRPLIAAP